MTVAPTSKPNPLLEIALTIIAPVVVLNSLSSEQRLGPLPALMFALLFPLGYGLWDAFLRKRLNWLAVIGVVSVSLTGGIGLLKLSAEWLIIKEAFLYTLMAGAIFASAFTSKPLIQILVFNADLFNVKRIQTALQARGTAAAFDKRLRQATMLLAGTFVFSGVSKMVLTRFLVSSPAGTEAFNKEFAKLTLWSYPLIGIPSMLMMMGLLMWLAKRAQGDTGLTLDQMFEPDEAAATPPSPQP